MSKPLNSVAAAKPRLRATAFALLLTTIASPASAHFEGALLSSRTASLGGAFVAIADDPSATVDNPAGLSGIFQPALLATYQRPYGVDGLDESFVAVAIPVRWVTVGTAWFHRGLEGALSEDRVTISLARDLKRTSEDASLSVGASVDIAMASASDPIDSDDTATAFGAGVLLRPFAFIGVGYTIRNINEPSLDLVEGGSSTPLARAQTVGLSYYWQDRLTVTAEMFEDARSAWHSRGGLELKLGPHIMLRGGLEAAHAAAGVGLAWGSMGFDAAYLSHDTLGQSYVVTLRYMRRAPARPYGQ